MSELSGKRVLLGVCGGIAAYKAIELARRLTQAGARVDVAMTRSATQFIGPLTFEALTRRPVLTDALALDERSEIAHVELGRAADLVLVAPATANMIGRLAHGLAEDPISVTVLATPAPVLLVPAMDHHMWLSLAVQANLDLLRGRGVHVLPPLHGRLASGALGWGRLPEPEAIVAEVQAVLAGRAGGEPGPLAGKRVLVTAGGTQEPIDPVRYMGNRSSGKMGIAIAEEALRRGALVTLVHAAVSVPLPGGVELVAAPTAALLAAAVQEHAPRAQLIVMAAAVADFRPRQIADRKIKKDGAALTLDLEPTADILASIAHLPLIKVGFAAETNDLLANAQDKLRRKQLDLIAANDVLEEGSGFGTDTNRVLLLGRDGPVEELPLLAKRDVAARILDRVQRLLSG